MTRKECLDEAAKCVLKDRQNQYGKPEDCFSMIAAMWSAYLNCCVSAHDVAAMMALLKIARFRANPGHLDNAVDLAGYAACMAETVTAWERAGQEEQEEGKRDHEFLEGVFAPYAEKPKAEGCEDVVREEGEEHRNLSVRLGERLYKPGDRVQVRMPSANGDRWDDAVCVSVLPEGTGIRVDYREHKGIAFGWPFVRPAPKAEGVEELVVSPFDAPQTKEELYSKILESNPATFKPHKPTGEELAEMAEEDEKHG